MRLDVRAGETFAADGIIVHGQSSVDASLLTGESRPASVVEGTTVFAGTLNVESPLLVQVEQAGETSRIATLLRQVAESTQRRAPIVQLANRLAGVFTAVVLVVAAATYLVKAERNAATALDDAIALLIVTCPCALALATPLAITVMEGVIDGRTVCIGSPRFVAERTFATDERLRFASEAMDRTHTPVHVAVDGVLIAVAALGDRVRDEALASLQQLRARGWRTVMLSGDATDVVASVGRALEFEAQDAIGAASPEDKRAFVERCKQDGTVVMVGDGVNDAAAIAAAHVGIGMHGGAEACLTTADIYLSRPGLSGRVELTEGARRTMRVIRRNIAFSIGYNILGASMAVAGILTPLIAAVLMPTSSISVVLGSWYGFTFARDRQGTAAP